MAAMPPSSRGERAPGPEPEPDLIQAVAAPVAVSASVVVAASQLLSVASDRYGSFNLGNLRDLYLSIPQGR